MSKKRKTREEKIKASLRTQFTKPTFSFVKGEFGNATSGTNSQASSGEQQEKTIQSEILASTYRDLLKTLVIASAIFIIEAVLYLAWK